MLSMADVERLEREYYRCVCAAGETGSLSLVEVADLAARNFSRLLSEHKKLLEKHVLLQARLEAS